MSVILIIVILRQKIPLSNLSQLSQSAMEFTYFDNLHGISCCHLMLFHYYVFFSTHFCIFILFIEIHTFFSTACTFGCHYMLHFFCAIHCNNTPPHYVTRYELAIKVCYSLYLRFIARFQ